MPILSWTEEYSVGVKKIDEQHKHLFDMINEAHDSAGSVSDEEVLNKLIAGMDEFANTHFAMEEGLMEKHGYPKTDEHKRQHNDFRMRTMITKTMQPGEGAELNAIKVFQYLADWLNDHILEIDMEMADFLKDKGVT